MHHGNLNLELPLLLYSHFSPEVGKAIKGDFVVWKAFCTNLLSKNNSGTGNPYILFRCGSQEIKTSALLNTLNPVWDRRSYRFFDVCTLDLVIVEVWDWDRVEADSFKGRTTIDLARLSDSLKIANKSAMDLTFPLEPRGPTDSPIGGTVTLELGFQLKA